MRAYAVTRLLVSTAQARTSASVRIRTNRRSGRIGPRNGSRTEIETAGLYGGLRRAAVPVRCRHRSVTRQWLPGPQVRVLLVGGMVRSDLRPAVLILALLTVVVVGAVPAEAAAPPTTSCQVFPADNIWNTDISTLPVHARSAQWLTTMAAASTNLHPDFGAPPSGFPYNIVDSTHPTISVTFQYASESDPGPYPLGADTSIENGSDHHALIIDRDTCTLYELYALSGSGFSWSAGSGAVFPLVSNTSRPLGWTSADAAGLPIFPGLVRWDEVQAGAIRHAIRFTAQQSDQSFLWPARHQAGTAANPALPPMGARFRLKGTYDISHFSPQARVIVLAMQHYGLILADNGSNWFFSGTEDAAWPDSLLSELKTIPASQFEAIDESALMQSPNSAAVTPACQSSGGTRTLSVPPRVCVCLCSVRAGAPPRLPSLPVANQHRWPRRWPLR